MMILGVWEKPEVYTVAEIAGLPGFSRSTAMREKCVLILARRISSQSSYRSIRMPRSVYWSVLKKMKLLRA
jgi:hypothetical protein